MPALTCDVCGGALSIDAGGKTATCQFCGAQHSMERMREKVQEIKGTVNIEGEVAARQTGTSSDVLQWKALLDKYMKALDFKSAMPIVKKILEAAPADEEANKIYDDLQELQYFDIRNGVLVKYSGQAKVIQIPEGVKTIATGAFDGTCDRMIMSDSVEEIFACPVCHDISFGKGVKRIRLPSNCVTELSIPEGVELLGTLPRSLVKLILPQSYKNCGNILIACSKLKEINASEQFISSAYLYGEKRFNEHRRVDYNGPPVKTTISNFIVNQIFPILTLAASRATPHI